MVPLVLRLIRCLQLQASPNCDQLSKLFLLTVNNSLGGLVPCEDLHHSFGAASTLRAAVRPQTASTCDGELFLPICAGESRV